MSIDASVIYWLLCVVLWVCIAVHIWSWGKARKSWKLALASWRQAEKITAAHHKMVHLQAKFFEAAVKHNFEAAEHFEHQHSELLEEINAEREKDEDHDSN